MTGWQKLIAKFLDRPKQMKYMEVDYILIRLGAKRIQRKGSHVKYKHPDIAEILTIAVHKGDCLPKYKLLALKWLKNLRDM